MADRVVSYTFRGNFTNLTAGLAASSKAVGDFGNKLTAVDKNGAKMRAGLKTVGDAAGKMGLVAAAGLGVVVGAAANFDKAMSAVQAATHESASNMELLRKAAIKAGADTQYSASEAAGAIEELAKAGVSTKDILAGGLSGALNLAAAGAIDVSSAAELAATALTQFKLSGTDVNHVADLLAAGAGKAQGSVSDLGMALKQGGLVASQTGLSIEETVGTLSAFASAGLIGSDAGTSFKTMLQALTPSSKQAREAMDSLGITAYDAQGNFVGMAKFAGNLRDALSGLTVEQQNATLKTIFGSDAVRAASVIYQQGESGIQGWINKTNDAGYAAETAATRMNNLAGDFEQFKGSLETALIGAGEGAQGPLRKIVQGATQTVNALNGIPGPAKNAATAMLGITAVMGGGLWFTSKTVAGIASMKASLAALGIEAETTRAKLALVGTGAAAVTLGVGTLIDTISQMDSWSRSRDAADATAKSYQDLADSLSYSNVGKYADDLHINLDRLSQDLVDNGTQGEYAKSVIDQLSSSSHGWGALMKAEAGTVLPFYTDSATKASAAHEDLNAIISNSSDLLGTGTDATQAAAEANSQYAGTTTDASMAAGDAAKSVDELAASMAAQHKAALAAFDAETQWRQALKDAAAQAAKNNAGIKGNTDAALGNRSALSSLAAAWNNQSKAVKNNEERFKAARAQFIQTAVAMGVPRQAAIALAKSILDIPRSHSTTIVAQTDTAFAHLRALKSELNSIDRHIDIYIQAHANHLPNMGGMGPQIGSADGSTVPKDGKPYGDRYPYLLAPGEEVISNRSGQADKWRPLLKAINAGHLADGGTVRGLANGGTTTRTWTAADGVDALNRTAQQLAATQKAQNEHLKHEWEMRKKLLEHELQRDEHEVERDKQRRDALAQELQAIKDSRRQLMQQVSQAFTTDIFASGGIDIAQYIANGGSLGADFGNKVYAYAQSQGATGAYNINDWTQQYLDTLTPDQLAAYQAQAGLGTLNQDAANADAFQQAIKKAKKHGLNGKLLHELEASGNLQAAQMFANMSAAQIAQYEKAYKNRQYEVGQTAAMVGNDRYGAAIHDQTQQLKQQTRILEQAKDEMRQTKEALHRAEKRLSAIEHAASQTGPDRTAQGVAHAINGAVSHGQRKGK